MEYGRVFRDGSRDEQPCVVVDMAATIFHEFTHVCMLNTDDANPQGCDTSYLANCASGDILCETTELACK